MVVENLPGKGVTTKNPDRGIETMMYYLKIWGLRCGVTTKNPDRGIETALPTR